MPKIPKTPFRILTFVLLLAAGFAVVGFGREYMRNQALAREIAEMQAENERLAGKKSEALSLIRTLSSEYYLEREARMKRNMAKPGETLIIVDEEQAAQKEPGQVLGAQDAVEEVANATKWMWYFFVPEKFEQLKNL